MKVEEKLNEVEQQNLSEKMRQLSTNATHEKDPIKIMKEIRDQLEIIPNYLTKQNISFKELMHQVLSSIITTTEKLKNNMDELRKIPILIYKIMVIQTYQYLWKTYFKSGTGQLIVPSETKQKLFYSTTLPIWPKEIKAIVLSNKKDRTNENEICLKFVNNQLNELQRQLKQYQQELNIKANNFQGYTISIQEKLMTYIEPNLNSSLSKKIEHQVELIHYDYHIQALKLEYFQHKPNEYQEIEKQNLSRKMSQLSTSATHEKNPIKIMKEIKDQLEIIPNYLTKQNISFKELMHQVLSSIIRTAEKSNNNIDELRKIAILLYKIMVIQTYQYLWKIYFKSGTGQLIVSSETKQKLFYSTTLPIWPKEIKTIVLSNKKDKTNENEICLKFVNNQLNELQRQLKQYRQELNIKANNFQGYTLSIQEKLMTYIEENLNSSFSKKIEHQVELIHYDYHIRALELEYFQHKPNEYQKQLMKQICQSKYEQETSEQEYEFLNQQIAYYNLPSQSFECSTISHHPSIDSIQNLTIREALMKQFKEVAIQSRIALFNLYLESAEDQREEYKKKHEANVMKINASQHTSNNNEKLSSTFVQLINERCNQIGERIQSIYKFKLENFLSKSNL
ncbi:unnamed protein product [Rotaria socialis]